MVDRDLLFSFRLELSIEGRFCCICDVVPLMLFLTTGERKCVTASAGNIFVLWDHNTYCEDRTPSDNNDIIF